MDRHPNDLTTDEQIDAALDRAKLYNPPRIVEAAYERGLDLFVLKLNDGRRLVYPRENLQALAGSTPEQAADFVVGRHGTDIWWPQLDEGHYLPNMLEGRTGNEKWMEKLQRRGVAA
jgi:Protein of unknown function (DUF2442)